MCTWPIFKICFVFRTWPTVRKLCLEIFFGWFGDVFFKIFWLPEIMTGSFRYCSRIYAWNWFTLFYMIKICCSTWAVTIFLSWIRTQHSYFRGKPTDPLAKWRVECGKRRYIQGWPLFHMLMIIYKFLLCFSTTVKLVLVTPSV